MSSIDRFVDRYSSSRLEDLPWYNPEPDADLVRWFERLLVNESAVIDLGAGPTAHGLWLARRGHRVTAVDAVEQARELALSLAEKAGVRIDYHVADVLEWKPAVPHSWDLLLDRGFLHSLEVGQRPRWLERVRELLRPGGHAVVKAFTTGERGFGPPGLTAAEMLSAIREGDRMGLDLISLELSRFNLSDVDQAREHSAWTLVARRPALVQS